jgi:F0F1-type ATP synthase assembly protein I
MDDISSRDDEKSRELAKEKGRQEEQGMQRQRELATEKGRKQGQEQEREREKGKSGKSTGMKIVLSIVAVVIVIVVAAILTLSVNVSTVIPGNPMPFTTNYGVSFPEGQTVTVGNVHIVVLSYQNELNSDIDGARQKLVVGEDRVISERRAVITTLGFITLVDTFFQINLKYDGDRDNRAYFDMAVHTSKQIPDILLNRLIPAEMDARPI